MEPMDEVEAVREAQATLQRADQSGAQFVCITVEACRALLARATRSHD